MNYSWWPWLLKMPVASVTTSSRHYALSVKQVRWRFKYQATCPKLHEEGKWPDHVKTGTAPTVVTENCLRFISSLTIHYIANMPLTCRHAHYNSYKCTPNIKKNINQTYWEHQRVCLLSSNCNEYSITKQTQRECIRFVEEKPFGLARFCVVVIVPFCYFFLLFFFFFCQVVYRDDYRLQPLIHNVNCPLYGDDVCTLFCLDAQINTSFHFKEG